MRTERHYKNVIKVGDIPRTTDESRGWQLLPIFHGFYDYLINTFKSELSYKLLLSRPRGRFHGNSRLFITAVCSVDAN